MSIKTWDPQGKYKEGFVKEYQYWTLDVSFRQHTLGCFIFFANREIEKMSDLKDGEAIELIELMREFESKLKRMDNFKPDRFNYLQMGNALHHLHIHAIPRYASPRNFMKRKWVDETYGHPPKWSTKRVDTSVIVKIRDNFLHT